ncbi:MAG TPA: MFS transporter [Anaerolineales bacterium]|nr:MFS transporter [Anaerolineales bacterium]
MTDIVARPAANPMKRVLAVRDFFLLWIGQSTSLLGDQFHAIAGAWLVLKLTGDPLALGTVLALGGIATAVFTVIGGAITDRISPRKVMLTSDAIRLCLSAMLATQIFTGTLQVWMIYIYSLVEGIVSGVFAPASMSMAPRLVPPEDLQAGNSVMQGSMQLIRFVGPAVAGGLIAAFPKENVGVGLALAIDAVTFIASIVTLWMMKSGGEVIVSDGTQAKSNVLQSIVDGVRFVIEDPFLKFLFLLIAVANLAFGGAVAVGVPFLADTRFPEGAAAYGLILSGFAGGNLLGIILSGSLPKMPGKMIGVFMVTMFLVLSAGVSSLAWIAWTWVAMADLFVQGVLNGYLSILLITSLQQNTPKEMLGRLMSMVLLAGIVLAPLSTAISGAVLHWNVPALFLGAGALLLICAVYLMRPQMSQMVSMRLVEVPSENIAE